MAKKAKASPRSSKPLEDEPRTVAHNLLGHLMRSPGLDEIEASNLPVTPASQGAPKPRLRDDQLTQYDVRMLVEAGEWTPDQAEAWAQRRGLPPFAGKPDAACYDPREEPPSLPSRQQRFRKTP